MKKKMKQVLLLISVLTMVHVTSAHAQIEMGELQGIVVNDSTAMPVDFATVGLFSSGKPIAGTTTDIDGRYKIKPLKPGTYQLRLSRLGYGETHISNIEVLSNRITFRDVKMVANIKSIIVVVDGERPIIERGVTSTLTTLDPMMIKHSVTPDIRDMAATSTGVYQKQEGGSINIRGSRTSGTLYIIDGIRTDDAISIPRRAIAEMTVITGGIPAMFGDATGGIVIINTKGYAGMY